MALELRPLDFGDRIGAAFKLYGANFSTLIAIVAVVVVPLQLLSVLVGWLLATDLPTDADTGLVDVDAIDSGVIVQLLASVIVLAIIALIGNLLATAGVMKAVADDALGRSPDWRDSLRFAFSKLGSLIAGTFLYALGILGAALLGVVAIIALVALIDALGAVLGVIGLIVAIIVLMVSWSIWVPALLVENESAVGALGRSNELVGGRRWPIFGYLLVIFLLVGFVNGVAGSILLGIFSEPIPALRAVVNTALAVLTTPITATAIVVLYFDQRVRNEGFDTQSLATHMGEDDDNPFGFLPPEGI